MAHNAFYFFLLLPNGSHMHYQYYMLILLPAIIQTFPPKFLSMVSDDRSLPIIIYLENCVFCVFSYCDASPDDLRRHGASQSHVFYFRGYGILFLSERNFSEQDFHCLRIQLPCQAFCSSERITVQKSTTGRCGCIAATGRNFCLACDTGSLLVSTAVFTEEIFP